MAALGISDFGVRMAYDYAGTAEKNTVKQNSKEELGRLMRDKLENCDNPPEDTGNKIHPDKNMTDEEWKKFLDNVDKALVLYKKEVKQETENALQKAEGEKEDLKQDQEEENQSKTDTEVIVKADGSKVLMITMDIGGTKSTMSIEIAKPSEFSNDKSNMDQDQEQKPEGASDISAGEILTGDVIRN